MHCTIWTDSFLPNGDFSRPEIVLPATTLLPALPSCQVSILDASVFIAETLVELLSGIARTPEFLGQAT